MFVLHVFSCLILQGNFMLIKWLFKREILVKGISAKLAKILCLGHYSGIRVVHPASLRV